MSDIIDLGGAPANEDCAQLGHTPDFERLNRLEVAAYRAAIIARFGPPPDGWDRTPVIAMRSPETFRNTARRDTNVSRAL